jgi:hypothetical protein
LRGNLASNAIGLIVAVIMRAAKIKPVQRLKILLWGQDTAKPTNPLFLSNKNNGLQGAKSGSSIPLNMLGGYRWPGAPKLNPETLERILYVEVAVLVEVAT